jgi:hypothetical protein
MPTSEKAAQKYFDLYRKHKEAINDHYARLQQIAAQFGIEVRARLGLPEHYRDFNGRAQPWMRFYQWDAVQNRLGAPVAATELDVVEPTGTLRFALGLALSTDEDAVPKTYFYMQCALLPHAGGAKLTLGGDESAPIELANADGIWDYAAAVSAFLLVIEKALDSPPFDPSKQSGETSRPIGFI